MNDQSMPALLTWLIYQNDSMRYIGRVRAMNRSDALDAAKAGDFVSRAPNFYDTARPLPNDFWAVQESPLRGKPR